MLDAYADEVGRLSLRLFRDMVDTVAAEWDTLGDAEDPADGCAKDTEGVQ